MRGKNSKLLIKASIVFILLGVLMGTVSANPGIALTVTPRNVLVQHGESAAYLVEIKSISTETEHVTLLMEEYIPGWGYDFSEPDFDITPGETKTSNLYVSVPATTPVGEYGSKVNATALVPGYPSWFAEKSYFTITTTVIPEEEVPALTPVGLAALVGSLSIVAAGKVKRRDHV